MYEVVYLGSNQVNETTLKLFVGNLFNSEAQ